MTATETTRAELERAAAPKQQRTIYDLIERQQPQIEKALPQAIGAERFTRIVLTELRRSPELLTCNPESLLAAMMLSAQLGLEPGPLGHVYLVPFKKQVTFIIGYKGMVELAYRSGKLKEIDAQTVYEGDGFAYEYGTSSKLTHRPARVADRGDVACYYALAKLTTGGKPFKVLYPEEIEAARKRSPSGAKNVGPWQTDYDAMARKTCVRRLSAFLPASPTVERALAVDEAPLRLTEDAEPEVIEGEVEALP